MEHVVRALTHALDGGRLHHAYLFTGTRGVGKTTLSRIFAKALNCETGVTSQPCGVCRACREIDEGRFVDYVEMDAASNRGVDEMAALLERAVYAPVDARFKVYMIDEVHMLTNHAFNAMLKTLEEPPPHVKFILATTDPQKIPVTVLSRCLQFNLKQMPAGHIVSHLERILGEEQITFEPQALRLLARAAQGSMRDALSLTDQAIAYSANEVTESAVSGMLGALDQTYMVRLLDALAAGGGPEILAIADEMSLRSLSFSTALQDLASLLHRIAWAQFAPGRCSMNGPKRATCAASPRRWLQSRSSCFIRSRRSVAPSFGLAPDEYAGFTMTLLRMLAFEPAVAAGSAPVGQPSAPRAVPVRVAAASAAAAKPVSAAPAEAVRSQAIAPAAPAAPVVRAAPVQSGDETDRPAVKPAAVEAAAPAPVDAPVIETPQPQAAAAPQAEPAGDQPTPVRKEPEPPAAVAQRSDERLRRPNRCRALRRLEPRRASGGAFRRSRRRARRVAQCGDARVVRPRARRRRRREAGSPAGRREAGRAASRRRPGADAAPRPVRRRRPIRARRRRRGRTSRPTTTCRSVPTKCSAARPTTASCRCSTVAPTTCASRRGRRKPVRPHRSTRVRCRPRSHSIRSVSTANGRHWPRGCRSRASRTNSRSTAN